MPTQGQIVEVLKRTNLLDKLGLDPTFVPFSYGEPEVAAALKGDLDVMFSSGQSVNNLLAKGGKWKVLGRLHFIPAAILVPVNSPIKNIKDLKGKTIARSEPSVIEKSPKEKGSRAHSGQLRMGTVASATGAHPYTQLTAGAAHTCRRRTTNSAPNDTSGGALILPIWESTYKLTVKRRDALI